MHNTERRGLDSKLTSDRASLRWREGRREERRRKEVRGPVSRDQAKWPYVNKSRSIYPGPLPRRRGVGVGCLEWFYVTTRYLLGFQTVPHRRYICIYVHAAARHRFLHFIANPATQPSTRRRIPKRRFLDECASSLISFLSFFFFSVSFWKYKLVSNNQPRKLCSLVARQRASSYSRDYSPMLDRFNSSLIQIQRRSRKRRLEHAASISEVIEARFLSNSYTIELRFSFDRLGHSLWTNSRWSRNYTGWCLNNCSNRRCEKYFSPKMNGQTQCDWWKYIFSKNVSNNQECWDQQCKNVYVIGKWPWFGKKITFTSYWPFDTFSIFTLGKKYFLHRHSWWPLFLKFIYV